MKHKIVGVIGENPKNDAIPMINLLTKKLKTDVILKIINVKNLTGGAMDSPVFSKSLADEISDVDLDYLIVLRDLDYLKDKNITEKERIKRKDKWFSKIQSSIEYFDVEGIFFLIIYELEALMLCDIVALNTYFKTDIDFIGNPIKEKNPKDFLQNATKNSSIGRYEEKDASEIFQKLDFLKLYNNHIGTKSFQTFADELKNKDIINFINN